MPNMSPSFSAAHNNSTGRQYLAFGNGPQNSVSDNGVQLNYLGHHTTVNMPPDVWILVQELINSRKSDKEPYHAIVAKWLTQQSGQPSIAPRDRQLDLLGQVTPGTGRWILSTSEFQRWKDSSSPDRFLFMPGTLGSGKSMLISIIIDSLDNQCRQTLDTICIYLFFHEKDATAPLASNIWASLILQLLQKQAPGGIANDLKSEFNDCLQRSHSLPPSRYHWLFKAQASIFKTVYLVIDGLDNCPNSSCEPTQRLVLDAIKDLPSNVRTLVSSRTDLDIRRLKPSQTLVVTPQKQDIIGYVKARIESDRNLHCVLKEHQKIDWVTQSITNVTSASGMFLLARLHLDTLSKYGTMEHIEKALSRLPENLDNAFEGAMQQILKKIDFERELASHVITWIVHAKVDLTIGQIQDSFAFRENKTDSWKASRPPRDLLVPVCAGLVVEDQEKGTLRLVHEDVKRHFVDGIICKSADREIAKTCLLCLRADDPDGSFETPLLEYASNHWAQHCPGGHDMDSEMEIQIKKFLFSKNKLKRAFRKIPDEPDRAVDGMAGLHAAVFYNMRAHVKMLIKAGADVNAQCSDNQTALHWAATLGRHQLVKDLVRRKADPNIPDASGNTPLHKCLSGSTSSNPKIIQTLVQGGAKLDIKNSKGLTPLSLVIRYGPTSLAELLITSQDDVNAEIIQEGWTSLRELFNHGHEMADEFKKSPRSNGNSSKRGWSPLKRAIDSHVHILMQLLFDRGVDLNRPTSDNWLPLIHAVKHGKSKTLQRLMYRKPNPANINLEDPDSGMSPLCLALFYNNGPIARQLMEAGCDLTGKNGDNHTPLILAVKNNDRDIVWLLLKNRAQPNIVDSKDWSALHYAIKGKNKDIAWLLMTKMTTQANGSLQAKNGLPLLDLALSTNDLSVAWLLCQHGADIHATDGLGMTALHKACREGNFPHVRFLLDMGSKIDLKDATNSTALHHSVLRELEDVVDLLASRASHAGGLDEQDDKNNTALALATILKNRGMVESLLRYGASCDVQDQNGWTALHRAASLGFNDGLSLMVAKTGNINLADNKEYTALHHAVNGKDANAETVDILCAAGADLRRPQEDGYSPWALALSLKKDDIANRLAFYAKRAHRMMMEIN